MRSSIKSDRATKRTGSGGYSRILDAATFRWVPQGIQRSGAIRTYLVDDMETSVQTTYGGLPNNLYVIDLSGRAAFKEAWSNPRNLERVLSRLSALASGEKPPGRKTWY